MVAPARKIIRAQQVTNYSQAISNTRQARKKIETDIEIGDQVLIDDDVEVKVVNKYNCAAVVEFPNHTRTVLSFDHLTKIKKEPGSFADETQP